jgi:hypothetical protein
MDAIDVENIYVTIKINYILMIFLKRMLLVLRIYMQRLQLIIY